MARRPSLNKMRTRKPSARPAAEDTKPETDRRKGVILRLNMAAWRQLKVLAATEERSVPADRGAEQALPGP